jgi:two-component system, NarL family, response regulator DegU
MKTIKLMFVDDQRLFVESLTHILRKVDRSIKVVSYALDGREAVEIVEREIPDVIMMDIRMPVMNGVEAVKIIHQIHPAIKIIMLTTYDDDAYVKDALRYGACGYLLKDIPIEDLVAQIKSVCYGNVAPISQSVLEKLTHTMEEIDISQPPPWLDEMNRTEKKILRLMVEGRGNDEIAVHAFLAEQTVRNYVHRIYGKLGVHGRPEAIQLGRKNLRFL